MPTPAPGSTEAGRSARHRRRTGPPPCPGTPGPPRSRVRRRSRAFHAARARPAFCCTGSQASNAPLSSFGILFHAQHADRPELEAARLGLVLGHAEAELHGRNIDEPGLRAVGHRLPVVRAHGGRPDEALPVSPVFVADIRLLDRAAGLQIDVVGPGHLADLLGRDQLSGRRGRSHRRSRSSAPASAPCAACRRWPGRPASSAGWSRSPRRRAD